MDRHVFTSSIEHGSKWDRSLISKEVQDVLNTYEGMAEELKEAYKVDIEKRDYLREFGWILTDQCTDGYDGKQHTITTYI